jgi:hypothetical protein
MIPNADTPHQTVTSSVCSGFPTICSGWWSSQYTRKTYVHKRHGVLQTNSPWWLRDLEVGCFQWCTSSPIERARGIHIHRLNWK